MAEFDTYALDYDDALNQGLSVSGQDKTFFAEGRIRWLSASLKALDFTPRSVLDYGCGTGTATPYLVQILQPTHVVGVDVSESSLQVARAHHAEFPVRFDLISSYSPSASIDLAYCNGVFHHIPLAERLACAKYVANCLRPGGLFALWENNPWNPGTRYVMSRIPFDRDAIMLSARTARKLVEAAGLRVLRTDYRFIFPKFLSALRRIEDIAVRLPFGAQYQVLCQKKG